MVGVKSNIFFTKGILKIQNFILLSTIQKCGTNVGLNTNTTPLKKEFFHNVNSRSKGWILSHVPKVSFDKPFFQKLHFI